MMTALIAGCNGTSRQAVVKANEAEQASIARGVIGTRLVGAQGSDAVNQRKIDGTVARLCSTKVWTQAECARHGRESRLPVKERFGLPVS